MWVLVWSTRLWWIWWTSPPYLMGQHARIILRRPFSLIISHNGIPGIPLVTGGLRMMTSYWKTVRYGYQSYLFMETSSHKQLAHTSILFVAWDLVAVITPRKPTWQWKIHHLKMCFLLKMEIFQCHVSFQGCNQLLFKCPHHVEVPKNRSTPKAAQLPGSLGWFQRRPHEPDSCCSGVIRMMKDQGQYSWKKTHIVNIYAPMITLSCAIIAVFNLILYCKPHIYLLHCYIPARKSSPTIDF